MMNFLSEIIIFSSDMNDEDLTVLLIVLVFIVIICVCVVVGIVGHAKVKQNSAPIESGVVKILDIANVRGNTSMHIIYSDVDVEFEDGTRKRLRNTKPREIIISKGDRGYITYQLDVIRSFQVQS